MQKRRSKAYDGRVCQNGFQFLHWLESSKTRNAVIRDSGHEGSRCRETRSSGKRILQPEEDGCISIHSVQRTSATEPHWMLVAAMP